MASYNSVTSTPLVLGGHGTWAALFAGVPRSGPGLARPAQHCPAPCALLPGQTVSAGHENPRDMAGRLTGYLILFIVCFYFSEERKTFKGSTSFCVVRPCREMSP